MPTKRTFNFHDTIYTLSDVVDEIVTGQQELREYDEQIDLGASAALSEITQQTFEAAAGIEVEDTLTHVVTGLAGYCFPYGGYRKFPIIVLQKRSRVCQIVEGEEALGWQWAWGDWVLHKYLEFTVKNEPHIRPLRKEVLQTHAPVRNAYGALITFHERLIPKMAIDFKTLFCDQVAWRFFEEYALSWIETEPTVAASNLQCGDDTYEYEQRRILLYPLGLDGASRTGNPVGPIEVRIVPDSWDYQFDGGAYGVYNNHIEFEAVHALPHHILDDIASADYSHSDDEDIERERAYQGITPWGDGGEAS